MSPEKEPHYFSQDSPDFHIRPNRFMITNPKSYFELFNDVKEESVIGEASTTYLANPETPKRIHQIIPNAKIVIILRDPINQFLSGYFYNRQKGWMKESLNESVLTRCNEPNKIFQKINGYASQVKRYLDVFSQKQVKIIFFEEFTDDTKRIFEEILEFLGINYPLDKFENKIYNPTKVRKLQLSKQEKELLVQFFQEDVRKLEAILKRKPPWPNFPINS